MDGGSSLLAGAALIPLTMRSIGLRSPCALADWSKCLAEINKHEAATKHLRGDQVQSCAPARAQVRRAQQEVDQEKK